MWQTFWAIFYKELLEFTRNKGLVRAILIVQLADILCIGFIDLTARNLPLVVVDLDHTAESRELVQKVEATQTFRVKYTTSSSEQARSHIRAGHAKAALVIPPDFSRLRAAGQPAQVLALIDGSDSVAAGQATIALDGVVAQLGVTELSERVPAVEAHSDRLFNPEGLTTFFMLPGILALILSSNYQARAMSLAKEREEGNLERLLMTPVNYNGLVLGKLAPHLTIATINGWLYLLVMRFGFGVPIRGSVAFIVLCVFLYNLCYLSFAAFIAADAADEMEAQQRIMFIIFPATLLSGFIFPLSSIPKPLLIISYSMPETHFIEIMRGVCLRGSGVVDLAPHFVYIAVSPVIWLFGAARRFSRSIMM